MRKRAAIMACLLTCACMLVSCESEKPKESVNTQTTKKVQEKGYVYTCEGKDGQAEISMDMDMKTVLDDLGEPVSYFEAQSCAFQGMDKIYTYQHVQIETYPVGEKDKVAAILFLDDVAQTPEGVGIGTSFKEMIGTYGTEYDMQDGLYSYEKGNMRLAFVIEEEKIVSVQYDSLNVVD